MSNAKGEPVYYNLIIVAASPATEIWLGDDGGHLVQKEIGTLETSLLPGDYTVEFGLGTSPYPIRLASSSSRPSWASRRRVMKGCQRSGRPPGEISLKRRSGVTG